MRLIDADALERAVMFLGEDSICNDCAYEFVNLIDEQPTIEAEPVWKPASVKPERRGEYLVVWSLTGKGSPIYDVMSYGTFKDWNDGLTEKLGWWDYDYECGVTDFNDNVRYWMGLPDMPEVEE